MVVGVFGLILTLHQLGARPLVDFDEALNAVITRNMVRTGNWLVPVFDASTRLRRPPLFFWLAASVVSISHQSTAVAFRLPSVLAGVALAVGLVVGLGRQFRWPNASAAVAGVCLLTMPYFLLLSRQAVLSVVAAALATAAILAGRLWTRGRGGWWAPLVTGAALGLLILDYSAMALLPMAVLTADAILRRRRPAWSWLQILLAVSLVLAIGLWWPLTMSVRYGDQLWSEYFFQNVISRLTSNVESGGRPIYYYPPLLAAGMGAWAPLAALAVVRSWRRIWTDPDSPERLALIWVVIGVVGFSLSTTKLPWYMGPIYPGLAILVAAYLRRLPEEIGFTSRGDGPRNGWSSAALVGFAALVGIALGLWPTPRPAWTLVACVGVGLIAIVVQQFESQRRSRLTGLAGSTRMLFASATLTILVLLAVGRALLFPLGPGAPGFAQNLQPEPPAGPEAAIGRWVAQNPRVPLGLLVSDTPTLIFYSHRSEVAIYPSVAAAAKARGVWLVTGTSSLAEVRTDAPGTRVLLTRGDLVLVALPGAPTTRGRGGD